MRTMRHVPLTGRPAVAIWETPRQRPQVSGVVARAHAFLRRHSEDPATASQSVQQAAREFRRELMTVAKQVLSYVSAHGGVAEEFLELRPVLNEMARWFPNEDLLLESVFSKAASISLKSDHSVNLVHVTGYFAQRCRKVSALDAARPPLVVMDTLHLRFTVPSDAGQGNGSWDSGWVAPTFDPAAHEERLSSPREAPRGLALSHTWSFYESHANAVLRGTEAFGPLSPPVGGITFVTLSGRVKEGQSSPEPELFNRGPGRRCSYLRFDEPEYLRQSLVTHRELLLDWIRKELFEPTALPSVMRGGRPR